LKDIDFYNEELIEFLMGKIIGAELIKTGELAHLIIKNSNLILILKIDRKELREVYYNFSHRLSMCQPGLETARCAEEDTVLGLAQSVIRTLYLWCLMRVNSDKQ
jgi:hypothetical protein